MYFFGLITLVLVTLAYASGGRRLNCRRASEICDFAFKNKGAVPKYSIQGPADIAFTNRIISKKHHEHLGFLNISHSYNRLGVLNSNDIAPEIIYMGDVIPIDHFHVQPRLTETHFKPFPLSYSGGSGVGHQVLTKSQKMALFGKCLRVYFTSYQILKVDGTVKTNVNNVPKSKNKCVVFKISFH